MDDEHSGAQLDASTMNPSLYHSTVSQLDSSAMIEHSDKEPSIEQEREPSAEEHERKDLAESTSNDTESRQDASHSHLDESGEHPAHAELSSNVSEEQRDELKERLEDMEGEILHVCANQSGHLTREKYFKVTRVKHLTFHNIDY